MAFQPFRTLPGHQMIGAALANPHRDEGERAELYARGTERLANEDLSQLMLRAGLNTALGAAAVATPLTQVPHLARRLEASLLAGENEKLRQRVRGLAQELFLAPSVMEGPHRVGGGYVRMLRIAAENANLPIHSFAGNIDYDEPRKGMLHTLWEHNPKLLEDVKTQGSFFPALLQHKVPAEQIADLSIGPLGQPANFYTKAHVERIIDDLINQGDAPERAAGRLTALQGELQEIFRQAGLAPSTETAGALARLTQIRLGYSGRPVQNALQAMHDKVQPLRTVGAWLGEEAIQAPKDPVRAFWTRPLRTRGALAILGGATALGGLGALAARAKAKRNAEELQLNRDLLSRMAVLEADAARSEGAARSLQGNVLERGRQTLPGVATVVGRSLLGNL